jgi:hypothetical protein
MVEANSHECSSFGFWPGAGAIAEPAFDAYAYPEPPGCADHVVGPKGATGRVDSTNSHFDKATVRFARLERPDCGNPDVWKGSTD